MSVENVPADIRDAASHCDTAVSTARGNLPTEVDGVAAALPGGISGATATSLAETWRTRLRGWADDVESHADSLRTAAGNWTVVEDDNARLFQDVLRPGPQVGP